VRFLLDADLPRSAVEVLRRQGHEAIHVRDIGLGLARDSAIAAYARSRGFCLVTGDPGFVDIRNYPPEQYHGIVVLRLPGDATARDILDLIEQFAGQVEVIERLPGRLAVVQFGRVRLRPQ